jgi:hypothetical protein
MEAIFKWMPLMLTIVQLLLAWVIWSMRKEFIRREECTTCASVLSQRVAAVESGLDSLPTSDSWGKMQVAIEEVRGSNRVVLAKLEGQSELLKRIEHPMQLLMEHHLRGDK